ncbi:MAG: glycoside hydrolase family 127 protein [Clostridia bacterium]|nr:glycoside hydrolase family 127 protein [Clostridia bacterium]
MIEYKVKNKLEPFALADINEKGYIGHLIERQIYHRINSDFARNIVYPVCEEVFRTRLDDRMGLGLWQGEFWGKWMICACRAARYKNDPEMKAFLHKCALGVISTQDEDGYIGTFKDKNFIFPVDIEKGKQIVGWPCDWNWNLWGRKYTFWGLIEAYELTGDKNILDAAERFFENYQKVLDEVGVKVWQTGTFVGMPSCSIMKPVLIMYRITGNKKYLDFAEEIADFWDNEEDLAPCLIRNSFSGKPIDDWYENHGGRWTKVYELLSCLDGLLELYRLTGVKRYYDAVTEFVKLIIEHEQNPLFSVGFNDQFISGGYYVNACSEPCDVVHWFRLIYELYLISGEKKYADMLEIIGYNPLMASITYDGFWGERIIRSQGKHQYAPNQPGPDPLPYHHCCVDNLPKGMLNFAESAVVREGKNVYINFFTPIGIDSDIKIEISDGYLCGKEFSVKVSGAEKVYVRIPEYCRASKLCGKNIEAEDGYYLVPDGLKSEFALQFDTNPRIVKMEKNMIEPEREDVHFRRFTLEREDIGYVDEKYMLHGRPDRVMYGPLLLARSIRIDDSDCTQAEGGHSECSIENCTSPDLFQLVCTVKTDKGEYKMCDYASAGKVPDEWTPEFIFNIYI